MGQYTDSLTKAYNRRHFHTRAEEESAWGYHCGSCTALILFDVDAFKGVNDRHGHALGDEILTALTQRIATIVATDDILARVGGDEFALLLPRTDGDGALSVAEHMRRRVGRESFLVGGELELSVTISLGVTVTPSWRCQLETLMQNADGALIEAKEAGRDRVRFRRCCDPG